MIPKRAERLTGIALGLLVSSAAFLAADAVFGFRETESVLAAALLTSALSATTTLPHTSGKPPVRRSRAAPFAATLLLVGVLTTLVIHGDTRSWFLVGTIILASLILTIAATRARRSS